jgi:hypothetical protein
MPMDMTNPPEQRNPPYRAGSPDEGGRSTGASLDRGLKIENMLLEEYNYAATTAYQAMEDRARMFNMYLLVVGILGSAFGAIYPLGGRAQNVIQPIAAVVLFAAGIAGIAFFVLLIRLRQAFRQSLITMAVVKEFYIREFQQQMPNIQHVFRWRLETVPSGERAGSATFIVCHMVGFIGALCFAGCVFMSDELLRSNFPKTQVSALGVWQSLALGLIVFLLVMVWMIGYYRRALNAKDEQKIVIAAGQEVDKINVSETE